MLSELYKDEADRIKKYIEQLTYSKEIGQGGRFKKMLGQVNEMDVVPCYIHIFHLYSYSSMWKQYRWGKEEDYQGFLAYAYLFWYKAISKHLHIGKNTKDYIKNFYRKIGDDLGGINAIKQRAEKLFNSS